MRERILAAAEEEFSSRGFATTSTARLARRAGVTQAMVFYYFGSKRALYDAVIEQNFHLLGDALTGDLESKDLPALERIESLLERYNRFCAAQPNMARILLHETISRGPRLRMIVRRHLSPLFSTLEALIAEAKSKGEIKALDPVDVLLNLIGATVFAYLFDPIVKDYWGQDVFDPSRVQQRGRGLTEMTLRGLLRK